MHYYFRMVDSKDPVVVGVVGSSSFLSCNMTPPSVRDAVYLVLWFKDDQPTPVYRYFTHQKVLNSFIFLIVGNYMTI